MDELRFQCGFCAGPIEHQEPVECSVRLADGGTQQIWCHVDCLRARLDPGVPLAAVLGASGAPPGVLRLTSRNGRTVLELSEVAGDDFRISVHAADHSASRRVCAYTDRKGVARLFADAARDWEGWRGAKTWESIERDLRLELRIDRLGHVTLSVRIRHDTGGPRWQLEAELMLEAGQLAGITGAAERLWRGERS